MDLNKNFIYGGHIGLKPEVGSVENAHISEIKDFALDNMCAKFHACTIKCSFCSYIAIISVTKSLDLRYLVCSNV